MAAKMFGRLSFEQVVHKYAQTVASVCLMRLQNYADADDCFQNVFIKLYTKSPEFSDENHLKAWLIRVAVNECKNYIRDNRRTISLESVKREAVSLPEDNIDISWALMKTPHKYREVLYLHYCEKYKVKEIAKILGIKENTVKTLLKQGRKILKSIYGGDQA